MMRGRLPQNDVPAASRTRRVLARGRVLGLAVLLATLLLRVWDPPPIEVIRVRMFDLYQTLQPRRVPDTPVVVVDIDEASLERFGQWPWPRTLLARLVSSLARAGVAAVGFNVLFAEPDRLSPNALADHVLGLDPETKARLESIPSNDAALAGALGEVPAVVGRGAFSGRDTGRRVVPGRTIAELGDDPRPFLPAFGTIIGNVPELETTAAGAGVITVTPELDGTVRRVPALVRVGREIYPALSLELLRVGGGQSTMAVRTDTAGVSEIIIGERSIPTDGSGRVWVRFARLDGSRYLSAVEVLEGTVPAEALKGRLTLIGTTAVGLTETKATPLGAVMPGVEIHAQLVDMVRDDAFLTRPNLALGAELALTLVVSLIIIVLVPALGAGWTLVSGALVVAGLVAASLYLLAAHGVLLDVTFPAFASFSLYLLLSALNYLREEGRRRQVRQAFAQYLAPSVVTQLADHPERLKLGGENKELSILFCDARGFTSIAERYGHDPQGLTQLITRLLTPLTNVVLAHGGTIDKYMGDCVMAFWNAPLDDLDHVGHACEAALSMIGALDDLNASRRQEAEARGDTHTELAVGIGVNTGVAVVGNIGTPQRFDYSVLGDAVNLASRLEGLSRTYGVDVVVGEGTAAYVDDRFALLELDRIAVRGKQNAVTIFALLGDRNLRDDPRFQELRARHGEMLAAYRAQKWHQAEALGAGCRELGGGPQRLYSVYLERIAYYRAQPPPADWDGVFVATVK
ncbi:MAG: CHASE2 domain-containing protein [Alphaproteobacteria bacterium]